MDKERKKKKVRESMYYRQCVCRTSLFYYWNRYDFNLLCVPFELMVFDYISSFFSVSVSFSLAIQFRLLDFIIFIVSLSAEVHTK